jgi:hypothetical protein
VASTNPAYPPFYWSPAGFVASNVVSFAAGVAVGAAIWGGCDRWGHNVIINVVRFNAFNHTDIANNVWVHNPAHRGDVPYRNAGVAERFDRADPVAARDALKDRFDAGRPVMSRTWDGIGNAARTVDPERRIPDVARDAERQADRMTPPPRDFGRPMADSLSLELRSRAPEFRLPERAFGGDGGGFGGRFFGGRHRL